MNYTNKVEAAQHILQDINNCKGKIVEKVSETENLSCTIYFTDGTKVEAHGLIAVELGKLE